jgi:hypothetical protein
VVPVDAEGYEILTSQGDTLGGQLLLRDVADASVPSAPDRPTEELCPPGTQWHLSKDHLQQAGLPRTVCAEHCDELAATHLDVQAFPQQVIAEA